MRRYSSHIIDYLQPQHLSHTPCRHHWSIPSSPMDLLTIYPQSREASLMMTIQAILPGLSKLSFPHHAGIIADKATVLLPRKLRGRALAKHAEA